MVGVFCTGRGEEGEIAGEEVGEDMGCEGGGAGEGVGVEGAESGGLKQVVRAAVHRSGKKGPAILTCTNTPMCGRFALRADRARISRTVPDAADWIDEDVFVPRYNIAPRTYAPVVRRAPGQLVLHTMKWGLVPHWSKVEDKTLSTTNARAENLVEGGGMWASIKGRNRCAVICQGYYEWLTKGREKLPHFVKYADGQLMLMAGLYDHANINGTQSTSDA